MAILIKDRHIVPDTWSLLSAPEGGSLPGVPAGGDVIVPLSLWQRERAALTDRRGKLGVLLASHEKPEDIAEDLQHFALIAIDFPKFTDGRGFSSASILRTHYQYRGELRAVGDVLIDQLQFMQRCGFDAFALRDDQDTQTALEYFDSFSDAYQSNVIEPRPLFRRRFA